LLELISYETEAPSVFFSGPEDEESELINVRFILQVVSPFQSSYSYRSQITKNKGIPLIASVPKDVNYDELYNIAQKLFS